MLILSETNKMSKYHLIHLVGYFDDNCQILRIISSLREKEILLRYFSKKSWPNKWIECSGTKGRMVGILQGLKQKGYQRQEPPGGSLEIPNV